MRPAIRSCMRGRQCCIGGGHVGELRVAAAIRQGNGVQDGRFWRPHVVGVVGVPAFAGNVTRAVGKAILVGEVMNLRALRDREPGIVLLEHAAEQADRRQQLLRFERLLPDHQDAVLDEGAGSRVCGSRA